ncbi:hypothetical protein BDR22DRAFT_835439 [Usnea florida]
MLDARSPYSLHVAQNVFLIAISIFCLPLSTLLLLASYIAQPIFSTEAAARKRIRCSAGGGNPNFHPKTVLVTGVGMTKGLFLARAFYKAGHNVIGADFEPNGIPVSGRFSKALQSFYPLPKPNEKSGAAYYVEALLHIVRKEKVDLWVSCSGVASAVDDGQAKEVLEKRSDVQCIQYDVVTTQMLHEKDSFIAETQRLGLPIPETHSVTSRDAVHKVLHESPRTKKKYIMKSVGMDDAARGDMTVLPKRTLSETYNHVSAIPISGEKPWVLQQFITGREYATHALVVNNEVKAFLACPSSEMLMHYEVLPADSALSRAMLRFTEEFVRRSDANMTGHLSFDFLIEEAASEKGVETAILPIECNPRTHTAVVLFRGQEQALAEAYLSALNPVANGTHVIDRPHINGYTNPQSEHSTLSPSPKLQPRHPRPNINGHTNASLPATPLTSTNTAPCVYWLGHDLITLLLGPLLFLLRRKITLRTYLHSLATLLKHVLLWRDGSFELWDPLPTWWLYHVYWPGVFAAAVVSGRKWSRVNVSTAKVFGC